MALSVLTKAFCENAPSGRHYDARLSGFGLYVGKTGARTFFVEYRPGHGRRVAKRRMSLGALGKLTVQQARKLAQQHLGDVAKGMDPLARRESEKRKASQRFELVFEDWLERDQRGKRSFAEVERSVRLDVLPSFSAQDIDSIRKRDVVRLLDRIADRGAPVMANRTLAHIRRLFRWALERDLASADPTAGIGKLSVEEARERVLENDETIAILNAAAAIGAPYGTGIRLLFFTGARRDEIFGSRWDELDDVERVLRLPASRSKNKQGRQIHLVEPAWSAIEMLPRFGPYIFTTNGKTPFSGFSKAKKLLDEACGVSDWRVHDIRRTVATGLQRLGVRLEVTETVLGHVSGSRSGIVGVYQRHEFQNEAREALAAWGNHLERSTKAR